MATEDVFDETTGTLARAAAVTVPTVQKYADMGLLEYKRASNGIRLFRRGQSARVQQILAQRMGERGRPARKGTDA
jgi:DNA-binding transcriptional MerR regulator